MHDAGLYYVNRFCPVLPFTSQSELTKVAEEFVDYQLLTDEDIPQIIWTKAKVEPNQEDNDEYHRMDVMSTIKSSDGHPRFKRLSKVAMLVFTIPHSNADEERVFSTVRKNKTPFRPSVGLDKTLPGLLMVKLATQEPCHKFEPDPSVVARTGKVTWEYNKEHRRSV